MSDACPAPDLTSGLIRSVLNTVDCHAQAYSKAGYLALTGPHALFSTALTTLLTVYVALLGYQLIFGRGGLRLLDAPIIALKIGFILALTLNWSTFETLVFRVSREAPLQIAQAIAEPSRGGASSLARDPVEGLQAAYDEIGEDAGAFGQLAGPNPQVLQGGEAAVAQGLWKAQLGLFIGTLGILSIASIALGVLTTVGPLFIALFLFDATRGLFAGWLRAMIAVALAPMLCWITTSILLVALEPWLVALAASRDAGAMDPQTAMVVSALVFIFCAAQAVLVAGAGLIAGGFALPGTGGAPERAPQPLHAEATVAGAPSRAERLGVQLQAMVARERQVAFHSAGSAPVASGWAGVPGPAAASLARVPTSGGSAYRRAAHFDRLRLTGRTR